MASRFIPNAFSPLLSLKHTERYFEDALENIVTNYPPLDVYHSDMLAGLWTGPTGIAYLLLHVSLAYPRLKISGRYALTWAQDYIRGKRSHLRLESRHCGIASEKLAFEAVRASITKDLSHVRDFVSNIPAILEGDYPNELLYGRAGILYLLRMIRHWVPNSAPLIERPIVLVSQKILAEGPDWKWHGKRYLGAVHGDVSILTQLVLTTPTLAQQLELKLDQLLAMQRADGNWPSSEGKETCCLTQFCHGAPGFVLSLVSLRPFFPRLDERMDSAIRKGRKCIWKEGLLRKAPSLCHGIFGNALALPPGSQRDHFLALASPENVAKMKTEDSSIFEPADYGAKYGTTTSYAPSAAWAWMAQMKEFSQVITYNDI